MTRRARNLLRSCACAAAISAGGGAWAQDGASPTIAPLPAVDAWDAEEGAAPSAVDDAVRPQEGASPAGPAAEAGSAPKEAAAPDGAADEAEPESIAADTPAPETAEVPSPDAEDTAPTAPSFLPAFGRGLQAPPPARARPALPGAAAGVADTNPVPVSPPAGAEAPGASAQPPPAPLSRASTGVRGSLWAALDARAARIEGRTEAAFLAGMAREGCPRDLLALLLEGAVEGGDALSALALEREILVLCRKRQEAVTALLEQDAILRDLVRPPDADAPSAGAAGPADWTAAIDAVPQLGLPEPDVDADAPAEAERQPEPVAPALRWFTLLGRAGDLRAGVTDGAGAWFVREGDALPGDTRVAEISADPPSVRVAGAASGALPWGAPP